MEVFGGKLRSRCWTVVTEAELLVRGLSTSDYTQRFTNGVPLYLLSIPQGLEEQVCSDSNAWSAYHCETGTVCQKDTGSNPDFGYRSFDNIGAGALQILGVCAQMLPASLIHHNIFDA